MKRTFTLFILFLFVCSASYAQISFDKTYGTLADEEGNAVYQTWDGGYIMGDSKHLVKTSDSGIVEWSKPIPVSYVNITSDSGYIITHNNGDIDFTRVDQLGNIIWTTTYSLGLWAREAHSIEETSDGGYIVGGRFQDFSGSGMMLLKLNATGAVSWRKTFMEPTSAAWCYGQSVHQTPDGGYILAGYTRINHGLITIHKDIYVVKTDNAGNTQWIKNIGGPAEEYGYDLQFTADGNYIIAGSQYDSTTSNYNMYLLKIDTAGNTIWSQSYAGVNSSEARSVWQTNDGGYIMAGRNFTGLWKGEDIVIRKVDALGNSLWTKVFGGNHDDRGNDIQQTKDGGYIITGRTESKGAGAEDAFLIKLDENGALGFPLAIAETNVYTDFMLYPNPSKGIVYIEVAQSNTSIRVVTLQGKEVLSQKLMQGKNALIVDELAKGIYLYQMTSLAGVTQQGKFMIQ